MSEYNARQHAHRLINDERLRQLRVEGYTDEHDRQHGWRRLVAAAKAYANPSATPNPWPFDYESFKPRGDIRNLVRAGALMLAALAILPPKEEDMVPTLDRFLELDIVERLARILDETHAIFGDADTTPEYGVKVVLGSGEVRIHRYPSVKEAEDMAKALKGQVVVQRVTDWRPL